MPVGTTDLSLVISTHPSGCQLRATTPHPAWRRNQWLEHGWWILGSRLSTAVPNGPQGGEEISRERLADPIVPQAGRAVEISTDQTRWGFPRLEVERYGIIKEQRHDKETE
ncbi:protein of unknown function [Kyrpidia spormannii]|uniref:Uncharacterized protein n=2 Tax=Kyrpidia spormannii TaxID=2055160 RepID=A0ACA8ZBZ8_9BACL|nr:protein of unknown function [Kyrpidia spormannii]CAB3395456.1 protein of unknown function [Kyrpidia spormannii]